MTRNKFVDITYDNGPESLDEPNPAADLSLPLWPTSRDEEGSDKVERKRLLKYCVIASLMLHVLAFTVVPRMSEFQQSSSGPKPVEPRTPVRLVEFQDSPKKEEPPPDKASAISDRDHTAKKERIPKTIPTQQEGTVFRNEIRQQQTASLSPPLAAEHTEKQPQEKNAPKPLKPQPRKERAAEKNKGKPLPGIAPLPKKEDMKNLDVALQPTAKEMRTAFNPLSGGSPDFYPDGVVEEAVVDMNSREDRFFSYLQQVQKKIEVAWVYPQSAGRAGIGGTLILEFVIVEDGKLKGLTLLHSSGHAILDQAALCAIRSAAPFHRFPARVRAKRLRIRASFTYNTTSDFVRRVLR